MDGLQSVNPDELANVGGGFGRAVGLGMAIAALWAAAILYVNLK